MSVKCWVCMDRGHVFYWQKWNGLSYEYAAYCDKCEAGRKQCYDGRNLEKSYLRNPYFTPPISQVVDADEIARKNKEEYDKNENMTAYGNVERMKKEVLGRPW